MTRPPTLDEAIARGLAAKGGILTFSNGTAWDCWAEANCYACWHWDAECAGRSCAFEGAALLAMVTPELARMFGWVQDPQWDTPTDHTDGWDAPDACTFFRPRTDDDGNDNTPPPDPDPLQLVLLADPTEDVALLVGAPIVARELVPS